MGTLQKSLDDYVKVCRVPVYLGQLTKWVGCRWRILQRPFTANISCQGTGARGILPLSPRRRRALPLSISSLLNTPT